MLLALNSVHADFRSQSGSAQNTGLKRWLGNNGIEVMDNFIVDAQCGSVSVITSSLPVNPDITIEFLSDSVPHAVVQGWKRSGDKWILISQFQPGVYFQDCVFAGPFAPH